MATRRDRVLASVETSDDDDRCRCPVAGRPVDRGRGACPNRGVLGALGALMIGLKRLDALHIRRYRPIDRDPGDGGGRGSRPGRGGGSESKALTARRAPVRTGTESLVGSDATVRSWTGAQGQVELDGGLWRARMEFGYDDSVPAVGESVVVEQVRGLTLKVRRREPWELPL